MPPPRDTRALFDFSFRSTAHWPAPDGHATRAPAPLAGGTRETGPAAWKTSPRRMQPCGLGCFYRCGPDGLHKIHPEVMHTAAVGNPDAKTACARAPRVRG